MTNKKTATPSSKPKKKLSLKDADTMTLAKVGSALVHFAEYHTEDGRPLDLMQAIQGFEDPAVQKWIKDMGVLLPLPRSVPMKDWREE